MPVIPIAIFRKIRSSASDNLRSSESIGLQQNIQMTATITAQVRYAVVSTSNSIRIIIITTVKKTEDVAIHIHGDFK